MDYLTLPYYTTLEARGKGIEAILREKDRELYDHRYQPHLQQWRFQSLQQNNQEIQIN
jgi:hypothetical protein